MANPATLDAHAGKVCYLDLEQHKAVKSVANNATPRRLARHSALAANSGSWEKL